ncbi:MAG: hypothetical protein OXC01_03300 [Immundisolibacterales bacterium]|nr:hypothetical protein [Immundisolibacterales bacterium]
MADIMIMGASYGALLGIKLCAAGHSTTLVCLPDEADLINREGQRVRMPVKGRDELVEVDSRRLPGRLSAATTGAIDPSDFDLVGLAMQEPQYGATGVRELLGAVARSGVPCMSIMNMPPLPYLKRIPGLDVEPLRSCYTDPSVWDAFDPARMTLCSPDAQAFRPPEEKTNVLQVSLPTNFRAARFESEGGTSLLRALQADIEAIRYDDGTGPVELPVKLKVHDSVFVPLAKWSMLLAGNYRCVQEKDMRAIRDAVHGDLELARSVYDWVNSVCRAIGASEGDQIPFEKYANAARGLTKPSSAARALLAGAPRIERADHLVQSIASQRGMRSEVVDESVQLVDGWLSANRREG